MKEGIKEHHLILWCGYEWLPLELVPLYFFFDDLTAENCSRMNSEVYLIRFSLLTHLTMPHSVDWH